MIEDRNVQVPNVRAERGVTGDVDVDWVGVGDVDGETVPV